MPLYSLFHYILIKMVNENISSCYPETEIYKQGVCSPYNEFDAIIRTFGTSQAFWETFKKGDPLILLGV